MILRMLTGPQVIVLATPLFFLLIAIEFVVGWMRGKNTYRLNDAMNSIGLGLLSQVTGMFSKLFAFGIYTMVFEHASIWRLSDKSPWAWVAGLIAYDFCYYWLHRAGHTVALFWAAHVVHHQSEDYNLSAAFLWNEHLLALPQKLLAAAAIVAGLWGVGALCTPRAQAMPAKGATAEA